MIIGGNMKKDTDKYWRLGIFAFYMIMVPFACRDSYGLMIAEGIGILLFAPYLFADWVWPYLKERRKRQNEQFEREKKAAIEKMAEQYKHSEKAKAAEPKSIAEAVKPAPQSTLFPNRSDQKMQADSKLQSDQKAQSDRKVQSDQKAQPDRKAQAGQKLQAEAEEKTVVFDDRNYVWFLGDLRLSASQKESVVFQVPEEKIKNLSDRFFDNSGIQAFDRSFLTEEEKLSAMRQILAFGRQWRRGREVGRDVLGLYSAGGELSQRIRAASHESHCYDGGNCMPDGVVSYTTSLRFCCDPMVSWEDLEKRRKNRIKMAEENFRKSNGHVSYMKQDRENWGYDGPLEVENIEVCTFGYDKLYLKDPFGMKGVFYFHLEEKVSYY